MNHFIQPKELPQRCKACHRNFKDVLLKEYCPWCATRCALAWDDYLEYAEQGKFSNIPAEILVKYYANIRLIREDFLEKDLPLDLQSQRDHNNL